MKPNETPTIISKWISASCFHKLELQPNLLAISKGIEPMF